eukprot:604151-Rhodomonas_salina.2
MICSAQRGWKCGGHRIPTTIARRTPHVKTKTLYHVSASRQEAAACSAMARTSHLQGPYVDEG